MNKNRKEGVSEQPWGVKGLVVGYGVPKTTEELLIELTMCIQEQQQILMKLLLAKQEEVKTAEDTTTTNEKIDANEQTITEALELLSLVKEERRKDIEALDRLNWLIRMERAKSVTERMGIVCPPLLFL